MKNIRLYCSGESNGSEDGEGCKITKSCLRYVKGTKIAGEMYRELDESFYDEKESKCSKFVPAVGMRPRQRRRGSKMKVRKLIKELRKLNPNEEITIYHSDSGTYDTIHEVIPANSEGLGDDEHGQYPASICP